MAGTQNRKEWLKGDEIPGSDLLNRYGIPRDELQAFLQNMRLYPADSAIITEGDSEHAVYILRWGSVSLMRKVNNVQEKVGTIDAVNFLGEVALINDESHNASIYARSEGALVYALPKANLPQILANPRYTEMIVRRLSRSAAENEDQLADLLAANREQRSEIERLRAEHDQIRKNTELTLAAVLSFQALTIDAAIVGSKGWAYLMTLTDVTKALIARYLPQIKVSKEMAEKKAMQDCLELTRYSGTNSITYNDLSKKI
jgi:CRP-like cAMP-binding protein